MSSRTRMLVEADYQYASEDLRVPLISALNATGGRYKRSLERYLLAVRAVVLQSRIGGPSWKDIAGWLVEALDSSPAEYDEAWAEYSGPPGEGQLEAKEEFDVTLQFQIADLVRMRNCRPSDAGDYFGRNSPDGHDWYNFDTVTYLECALAGISDNAGDEPLAAGWRNFALFLELGRLYE